MATTSIPSGARRSGASAGRGPDGAKRNTKRAAAVRQLRKQHLTKPGNERDVEPRPPYHAPSYKGSGKLAGKTALITGGDSGIGRAVAVLYAREGADVSIVYLNEHEDARETASAVEAEGGRCLLLPGDVTEYSFCMEAVERTYEEFGRLDILVNNAGYQLHAKSLDELTEEHWDRTFKTNVYGYFHMAKAASKYLKEGGVIINTGSVTGLQGSKELLDYSSTKGAIHAFTKSLAQNLLERGIRVNCVAPGPVWTPLNPSDRPAQPEEIAPSFVFLAAPSDSSYITGEVLPVIGGETV